VTAGNASGINDGAAAVMVMTAKKAAALGLTPLGRIASFATSGLDPATHGHGPGARIAKRRWSAPAGRRRIWTCWKSTKPLPPRPAPSTRKWAGTPAKVNVNGGAIAIGHPIGASGCRILVTLLHEMQRRDAKKGIASLCIGGGMGVALTIER
jgi:acetyl-CoA C-acetyltransferase